MRGELASVEAAMAGLQGDLDSLRPELEAAHDDNARLASEVESLTAARDALHTKYNELKAKHLKLREDAKGATAKLKARAKAGMSESERLAEDLHDAEARIAELEAEVAERETTIETKESELAAAAEAARLQGLSLGELERRLATAVAERDAARVEHAQAVASLNDYIRMFNTLRRVTFAANRQEARRVRAAADE